MKILLKLVIVVLIVFYSQRSDAASIDSWSILSPLSGANLSINAAGQTQVSFTVTCTRSTLAQIVNISIRLRANAGGGANQAMHSDVYIKTQDFMYGGTLHKSLTKTFTVAVDLSKTYYPGQTTVSLSVDGVGSIPSNSYPVIVPIQNNSICCSASYTGGSAPSSILTGTIPTGGNGTYTYQWQFSVDSLLWLDVVPNGIDNGKNATYTRPLLTQTTYYKRIVISNSSPAVPQNVSLPVSIKVSASSSRIGNDVELSDANAGLEVLIYPNPFSNEFAVHLNGVEITNIEIINSNGAVVYSSKKELDNQVVIDANSWVAGIFYLRVVTADNKLLIRKIIKN